MLPKGDVVICSVGHYCRCDTSGGPYNVYLGLQVQIQTYKRDDTKLLHDVKEITLNYCSVVD